MSIWQLQTAKQRFSEVVRAAETGDPQFITRHGQPVAVIIDIADYRASHTVSRPSLSDYLTSGPLDDLEVPERRVEHARATSVFGE
jgi:prevent-host-death family protein